MSGRKLNTKGRVLVNTTVEQQVREYYDHAGPAYHALMGQFWHHGDLEAERAGLSPEEAAKALARKQIDAAGLRPGGTGLDFGSGVGGTAVYTASVSGANVVGISNNEWLSAQARAYAAEQGMSERAAFLTVGDEDYKTLVAWPAGSLDMVSFYESVCHLPEKAAFFTAAFRVLKPGACLVGVDWIRRPFGEHLTEEQIAPFIGPVEQVISIPRLGTLDEYREMMSAAGFVVEAAEDLYPDVECWGSTPPDDGQGWGEYAGEQNTVIHDGKRVLDAARAAGVFSVARWVARKPG
ncbi:SAM-dependent methyltransferase [Lentzea albidocapillata]|uniref:Cyclopropane fatty-acyl-phospholipid synthase n=1 Tax=Lentzea albidocapillata TaxID=40571 RepID=A0A1W2FHJ1_9PSEU|nr:methyltransferase domain-containing protein [Lentzea albidocapillata]SMD21411.1 Cyclopropane fatty-acyl-phospholipid synthase [Lentzea albidocapillata]